MLDTTPAADGLTSLRFVNTFAQLPDDFYERRAPAGMPEPHLVIANDEAAALIGFDPQSLREPEFLAFAAGNAVPSGAKPVASAYAGHQFGVWAGQLGDGRALILGEVERPDGARCEISLKGGGPTAFSRSGDGRAVLRSTIREYLASEAMHYLGIPTTRALAIAGSPLPVFRERRETAATLLRLAPTHVRFGSFELFAARKKPDLVQRLADYTIDHDFAHLRGLACETSANVYALFFGEVVSRTARLMALWTAAGFAHGVMNTDNMSIAGLTLDYGPYGFLDAYQPGFICNHTDEWGRYAFDRQPSVAFWNLQMLARALGSLVDEPAAVAALETFEPKFRAEYVARMRAKAGLAGAEQDDLALIADLLRLLERDGADYTHFFRALGDAPAAPDAAALLTPDDASAAWFARYAARVAGDDGGDPTRRAGMNAVNPKYVLRNHLAQTAIEAAERGDFSELEQLAAVLRRPYDDQPGQERFAATPPDWAKHLEVSCSS